VKPKKINVSPIQYSTVQLYYKDAIKVCGSKNVEGGEEKSETFCCYLGSRLRNSIYQAQIFRLWPLSSVNSDIVSEQYLMHGIFPLKLLLENDKGEAKYSSCQSKGG